ncbi:MAG: class I SAM-dependent methyltransferase [Eubacteriales bacterium]|nr:class I SAM-dependent methyltransferase [Eubacteriales bacterium]
MLEKMDDFFNRRLEGYEEHQLNVIEGAREFYPYTASLLPKNRGARVLDLECGTGLELDYYFALNPSAQVVGVDLAGDMLATLRKKSQWKTIATIQGSYFDIPFGKNQYDAVVSVESLHHFTKAEKNSYVLQSTAGFVIGRKLYPNRLLRRYSRRGGVFQTGTCPIKGGAGNNR